ncbi:putative dynein light chain type 1 family protein [Panicum miliaceum]|uniref:Dynein light chain type 1 family protein n=1 Tax=Panicum miliaceum TaxID=4540 RepID=A0A3L6QA30_PANMI|nr:putative dynein light chain type 1 family protein [Panicum miliaceum]
MDPAFEELERRSRYLSALVRRTRLADPPEPEPEAAEEAKADAVEPGLKAAPRVGEEEMGGKEEEAKAKERAAVKAKESAPVKAEGEGRKVAVCVRAADMALPLQRRAVRIAVEAVAAMPRLETKRLALALKKDFDTTYGPAWHCIVGTSFGSYVTHSLGGFLYFSVDKVYILLFRTAVEPLAHPQ